MIDTLLLYPKLIKNRNAILENKSIFAKGLI